MRAILTAILVCCLYAASSQDLVVTKKGDSLNCKITRIKPDYIYFTFKHKSEIRNTLLPLADVEYYQEDFYSTPVVPLDDGKAVIRDQRNLRLKLFGGWSYRTASISPDIDSQFRQYVKELKSGFHLGGDMSYFFSENIGLGLRYSIFKSRNERDNVSTVDDNGQVRTGQIRDNITIQYIGPVFSTTYGSSKTKPRVITNISLGYLRYRDRAVLIDKFTLTGKNLGLLVDVGVLVPIDKHFALDFTLGLTAGTLKEITYQDNNGSRIIELDKDSLESLARLDLSIGINLR